MCVFFPSIPPSSLHFTVVAGFHKSKRDSSSLNALTTILLSPKSDAVNACQAKPQPHPPLVSSFLSTLGFSQQSPVCTQTHRHTDRQTHTHTDTHTHTWTHTDTHARARISHCLIAAPLFFQTRPPPSSVAVETLHRFASTPPRDRRFRQFSETFHSDRHGVLCVEFTGQSADKLRRAFAFPQHNNNNSSSSSSSSGASTRNNLIFPLRTAPTFEFLRKHADLLGSTVSVRTLGGVGNKHMLAARCSCPNLPQDLATATEGHVIMGTSPTVRPGYPVHFLRKKPPVQRKRVDVQGRIVYKCDKCVSSFEAGGRKRKRERKGEREGERDVMTRGREARTCISGFHSLCLSFVP